MAEKMSEKEKHLQLIQGGIDEVSDEDFRIFMEALLGKYKGSGYNPE
jgi:hypothetical protein